LYGSIKSIATVCLYLLTAKVWDGRKYITVDGNSKDIYYYIIRYIKKEKRWPSQEIALLLNRY